MQPFFITSTGTDIGKTLVTTTLCWQLRQAGKKVTALKPVISGYDPADPSSDTALILKSCGLPAEPALMETISPWRYSAALAPNMAARHEGKPQVDTNALVGYCRDHASLTSDIVLVEGVGGVMVPINDSHTVLDWMAVLAWPALLVAGSYLGSISHTLSALEVLSARNVPLRALLISESEHSTVRLDETVYTLSKFVSRDVPILKIPRRHVSQEAWKQMPLISWICDETK